MTAEALPPKPELLKMRWVCGLCLNVIEVALDIEWVWRLDHAETGVGNGRWRPHSLQEPRCHGRAMLIAGKPKLDVYGSGLMVDPVENLRCPKIELSQ